LTPDLLEMKEEVKAVLTEEKMETKVDQGQLAARNGGWLLPVKFGDETWASRGPNKGKKMVRGRSLPCNGARQRVKTDGGSSGR
jgi:hypothetical protein